MCNTSRGRLVMLIISYFWICAVKGFAQIYALSCRKRKLLVCQFYFPLEPVPFQFHRPRCTDLPLELLLLIIEYSYDNIQEEYIGTTSSFASVNRYLASLLYCSKGIYLEGSNHSQFRWIDWRVEIKRCNISTYSKSFCNSRHVTITEDREDFLFLLRTVFFKDFVHSGSFHTYSSVDLSSAFISSLSFLSLYKVVRLSSLPPIVRRALVSFGVLTLIT